MTRAELIHALRRAEIHVIKAKRQRRQAIKDGLPAEEIEDIDLAIADLVAQCRGFRKAIKVKEGMLGLRRSG